MLTIKINNIQTEVNENETVLDVAQKLDIHIPTMCWLKGFKASSSCMVCIVHDKSTDSFLPSCSALVQEGMDIITDNEEIEYLRKDALELLLSEHSGDCDALCQRVCPAGMDIPLMNRYTAQGKFKDALKVVKQTIPIPAVLGYICPAPCEKSCRRKDVDETVSICEIKRFTAEEDLNSDQIYFPQQKKPNGRNAAIIGSGPMGLTVAYYLTTEGYSCKVYDENDLPGGKIRTEIPEDKLPEKVLDAEIDIIKQMGVKFFNNRKIDLNEIKNDLSENNEVIIIAGGFECNISTDDLIKIETPLIKDLNIFRYNDTVIVYPHIPVKKSLMSIRSVRTGLRIVESIKQVFNNKNVNAIPKRFNSVYSKLIDSDKVEFLRDSENHNNKIHIEEHLISYKAEQAIEEAKRCMHCDCREKENCKLRDLSDEYNAKQNTYILEEPVRVKKIIQQEVVIYEPGKCIKCGICIQTCEERKEDAGFTYIGRGFDVKIGFPLNNTVNNILKDTAVECAKNCPTGAIAEL